MDTLTHTRAAQATTPRSHGPVLETQADFNARVEAACAQACRAIAPAWPLDRAIAVNPHWERIGRPVREVAARMAVLGGMLCFWLARSRWS